VKFLYVPMAWIVGSLTGCLLTMHWYGQPDALETVARLAKENAEMRLADNRMLRSRTGFRMPKVGAWDYAGVSSCAKAVGWPPEMLMALRKTENGGMLLDLGIQSIPANIRRDYPPSMWQYAAGQQILVQEAGRLIYNDRATFDKFSLRLSKRWKARDTKTWRKNFSYFVKKAKGPGVNGSNSNGGKNR